jgi:hypothetical protein
MKHPYQIIFVFLFLLGSSLSKAQSLSPYSDALKLSDSSLYKDGKLAKSDAVNAILAKYIKGNAASLEPEEIRLDFNRHPVTGQDQNPFIEINGGELSSLGSIDQVNKGTQGLSMSSISSLDVTTLSQGVSQFLIKRAKQELTATFFNRLQKQIAESPELKALFPKTATVLENMISYHYSEILPTLQNYFQDDIENLPKGLNRLTELNRYKHFFEQNPEVTVALKTVELVDKMGKSSMHPIRVIREFSEFEEWNSSNASISFKNYGNTLKMASILSHSLTTTNDYGNISWLNYQKWTKLLKKPGAFEIYLGLVYQQIKNENIQFIEPNKNVLSVSDFMKNNTQTVARYQAYISSFVDLATQLKIESLSMNAKRGRAEKVTNEDLYQYINSALNIIEYASNTAQLIDQKIDIEVKTYTLILRNGNELFKSVFKQDYNTAVFNATLIYQQIADIVARSSQDIALKHAEQEVNHLTQILSSGEFEDKSWKTLQKDLSKSKKKLDAEDLLKTVNQQLVNIEQSPIQEHDSLKNHLKTLANNLDELGSKEKMTESVDLLKKYGAFFANVAKAKSPDEVQSAIEAAVLPVGSSSIKKQSKYNISLQAYVGMSYNLNANSRPQNAWENPFGVTAPIGVSFNRGLGKGGSLSLFISLIDLGAIVDYDLQSDSTFSFPSNTNPSDTMATVTVETNSDYKVELGQIFSPGIFVAYGFGYDIPLTLSAGAQYGPGLLQINQGNTEITSPNWRFVVSLTVDIPLFTLYNQERRRF